VIRNAKGLAIFTTMRTGLWFSGAGGSGILVGRKEDGNWSPPSGIMLHTAGLGFLVGVDIYDCVVVINTQAALDAFSAIRCTLGGEISAVAGPVGVGGVLETEVHKRQAPVFNYLKSRGFYAGVQIDGTIIIERTDENERFYGERIGVKDILAGKIRHPPYEIRTLLATIKAAQGDTDVDQSLLPKEPPPADFEIENERQIFGVPDKEDPDPFGVLALEQAGLEIREAGTRRRPTSEQFEFKPSPTSPIYPAFRQSMDRSSIDGRSRRSSWRTSAMSSAVESRASTMVDTETQTDLEPPPSSQEPPALPPRQVHNISPTMADIPEDKSIDEVKLKETTKAESADTESKSTGAERNSKTFGDGDSDDDVDDADDADDEEPVIEEIHQATAPQAVTRARIVTVAKPIPPKLPPRSPLRTRSSVHSDASGDEQTRDMASGPSPVTEPHSPATPSLRNDGSSASSQDSISSMEVLEKGHPQPHTEDSRESARFQEKEEMQSVPTSPMKTIPGGFI
jgi:lipid-binding SYLF domain-containing protein